MGVGRGNCYARGFRGFHEGAEAKGRGRQRCSASVYEKEVRESAKRRDGILAYLFRLMVKDEVDSAEVEVVAEERDGFADG